MSLISQIAAGVKKGVEKPAAAAPAPTPTAVATPAPARDSVHLGQGPGPTGFYNQKQLMLGGLRPASASWTSEVKASAQDVKASTPEKHQETINGVQVDRTYSKDAKGVENETRGYTRDGAKVAETTMKKPDGSYTYNSSSVRADGTVETHSRQRQADGREHEVVTIENTDHSKRQTSTDRYQSDKSIEELNGKKLENPHVPPECAPGQVPAYKNPPGPEADPNLAGQRGSTQVEESKTVAIDANGNSQPMGSEKKYTQKRANLDGVEAPGDVQVNNEKSGFFVTYSEKIENNQTTVNQSTNLHMEGKNKDHQEVSLDRTQSWDPKTGNLQTTTDARGFKREDLQQDFKLKVAGHDVDVRPFAHKSKQFPTDQLFEKGNGVGPDKGDADQWLGLEDGQPLNVRVTESQSANKEAQEVVELGNYAHPDQDGKTVSRYLDKDGLVHWGYHKVSNGGQKTENEDTIQGTDYKYKDTLTKKSDGGYWYDRSVEYQGKTLSSTSVERKALRRDQIQDPELRRQAEAGQTIFVDDSRSTQRDPQSDDFSSVTARREFSPTSGLSKSHSEVLNKGGSQRVDIRRDPATGVHARATDDSGQSHEVQADANGNLSVDGKPVDVKAAAPGQVPALDQAQTLQSFLSGNGVSKLLPAGAAGALGAVLGVEEFFQGRSEGDLNKQLSSSGQIIGSVGSVAGFLGAGTWATGLGVAGGVINAGTGVYELIKGDTWNGGLDIGIGAAGAAVAISGGPVSMAVLGGLCIGKITYGLIQQQEKGNQTASIDIPA